VLSTVCYYNSFQFHKIDIHVVAAIRSQENYENLANGFRDTFAAINSLINDPVITINRNNYTLEFFLCADYKVSSIMC